MGRSTQRIRASSRARQLKLTAAATLGLALMGGSVLFLLHRTMPVPMQPAPASGASRPAGVPIPAAPAAAAIAAAGMPAARLPGVPTDSAVGPLPRPESAPVSLRVPMPTELTERLDDPDGERRADDARARRTKRREAARDGGAESTTPEPARTAAGGAARSAWGGELEAAGPGPGAPSGASAATRAAKTVASSAIGASAPARSEPERLEPLQQTQCADSEFLMKLICSERVRLRFCQSRWNAHPDCMVEARPLNH